MPTHKIYLHFPRPLEVVNSDAVVEIHSGDEHHGDLHFSRGSIDWRPTRASTSYWLDWERFAELMVKYGEPHNPHAK
jgi:hypothetical protein